MFLAAGRKTMDTLLLARQAINPIHQVTNAPEFSCERSRQAASNDTTSIRVRTAFGPVPEIPATLGHGDSKVNCSHGIKLQRVRIHGFHILARTFQDECLPRDSK